MSLSSGPTYLAKCSCNRKPIGTVRSVGRSLGRFAWCALLILLVSPHVLTQSVSCYAGFEISEACITERALDREAAIYQRKITEAMTTLGVSYKIALRLVNNP